MYGAETNAALKLTKIALSHEVRIIRQTAPLRELVYGNLNRKKD